MNKFLYRLKRFRYTILPSQPFSALPEGITQERCAEVLRADIRAIIDNPDQLVHSEWHQNVIELRKQILSSNNPSDFLNWPVVIKTMFHISRTDGPTELDAIRRSDHWKKFSNSLRESAVGQPPAYSYYPISSSNLIHVAYNILQLMLHFNIDPRAMGSIVEFGGGYGALCRLLYSMGFGGHYTIFDLPEFTALQRYYLSMLGLYTPEKISLISELNNTTSFSNSDLCIMTWSLSESPVNLRRQFLDKVGKPRYFLIAYQIDFAEVDNIEYFSSLQKSMPEYEWVQYDIPHLKRSCYLLGKKK